MLENGNGSRRRLHSTGEIPLLLCLFALLTLLGLLEIPTCPLRWFGENPCPTCGTTRSVQSIIVGNFTNAWRLNPIGFVVVLAFAKRCGQLYGTAKLRRMDYHRFDLILLTLFLLFGVAKVFGWT